MPNDTPETTGSVLDKLRREAARKSNLDRDKQLLTEAAAELEMLLAACQDCMEDRGDWGNRMAAAIRKATGAP